MASLAAKSADEVDDEISQSKSTNGHSVYMG